MGIIAGSPDHQVTRSPVTAFSLAILVAAGCRADAEQPTGFAPAEGHPVTAELITEHASIQPGGTTRVGVHFELEEGWLIYAKEPGDAGLPTKIEWSGAVGTAFGPLTWPAPQEFRDPGDIHTFGYTRSTVLSSTMTIGMTAAPFTPIQAKVSWLACKDVCIPGKTELQLALPVSSKPPAVSTHAQLFEHTD